MKVLSLLASALLVASGSALVRAQAGIEPGSSVEIEILRLENERIAALIARDYRTLAALMAIDCVFVDPDGSARTTEEFVANLKAGASVIDSFVIDENRVRVVGEIALVTGRYHNVVRKNGTLQPVKYARHTRVWMRQPDKRWRLISHQATTSASPGSAQ